MKALVVETERAWQSLGGVQYGIQAAEEKSISFKRSIYVVKDIAAGETITEEHLRVIRPGDGLHPKYLEQIVGRRARTDMKRGTPLAWSML